MCCALNNMYCMKELCHFTDKLQYTINKYVGSINIYILNIDVIMHTVVDDFALFKV